MLANLTNQNYTPQYTVPVKAELKKQLKCLQE